MITLEQYFRKPSTEQQESNALELLERVNALIEEAVRGGSFVRTTDPDTDCEISGVARGDGDGGFRAPGSRTGGPGSSHREGRGVDVYDPGDRLDTWLDAFELGENNVALERHGLYREHATATPGWCHLTTRAPGSGKRTFYP